MVFQLGISALYLVARLRNTRGKASVIPHRRALLVNLHVNALFIVNVVRYYDRAFPVGFGFRRRNLFVLVGVIVVGQLFKGYARAQSVQLFKQRHSLLL